ncbi:MAG: hypothetical protein IPN76_29640 [Saprospiraceae bacterium]|nr:hypothetical protein [Saprospiraceae bacterium]
MEELKQQLKSILVEDLPQLFTQLKQMLLVSSSAYNETIQQAARYNQMDTEKLAGRVSAENANLVFNQVTASLTKIIDSLEPKDLKPNVSYGRGLHEYHRLTCDRVDQSDKFQQLFQERKAAKSQFSTSTASTYNPTRAYFGESHSTSKANCRTTSTLV